MEAVNQAHHRVGKDSDYYLVTLLDMEAWFLKCVNPSYEMNVRLGKHYQRIDEWMREHANG